MSRSEESRAKEWDLLHDITGHAEERFTERFHALCYGLDGPAVIRKMDEEIRAAAAQPNEGRIRISDAVMDAMSRLYGSDEFDIDVEQNPRPFYFLSKSYLVEDPDSTDPIFVVGEQRKNFKSRDGNVHTHTVLTVLTRTVFENMLRKALDLAERLRKQPATEAQIVEPSTPSPEVSDGSETKSILGDVIRQEIEAMAAYFRIPVDVLLYRMIRKRIDVIKAEHPEIFEPKVPLDLDDVL